MKKYLEKIDQKNLRLILVIAIVLTLFGAYELGYVKYVNKTDAVEEEITTLQQRYDDLSAKVAQEATYKDGMASFQENIQSIMNQYGPGNTPEKSTKFLIDLTAATGVEFPTVSFSQENLLFESAAIPTADGAGVSVYSDTLTLNFKATYQGLKDCMDYINKNPEKMNVASIAASFDSETGELSGNLVINQYSMTGTGKTYEPPVIDGVPIGTNSIFGTFVEPKK